MTTLISMPADIIEYLRETVEQSSGKNEAEFAVYRFGSEWAKAIVKASGERCPREELTQKAALTAVHTGITNMDLTLFDDRIHVRTYDNNIDNRFFLAGYISGTISELLGREHVTRIKDDYYEVVPMKKVVEKEMSVVEAPEEDIDLGHLNKGQSYIVLDDTSGGVTFQLFLRAVEKGLPGLCFTRVFPSKIKDKVSVDFPIFWLSIIEGSGDIRSIKPERYNEEMLKIIKGFLSMKHGIFMIDGFEFLIANNGFDPIFRFLQEVRELTEMHNGIFLLALDPDAMESDQFNKIRSEMAVLDI